jgi:hypothetical protein
MSDPDGRVGGVIAISFNLLGDLREFTAGELPPVTSPHTGRSLRRVALELRVPSNRREELDAELEAASGDDGRPLQGPDAKWFVSGNRVSYGVGAQPEVYTYQLELQEAEDLTASAVEIRGLVLVPTAYRESVADNGNLVATFVTEVTGDEVRQLEELIVAGNQYFDVIRRGITDAPMRMRFGRCLWQEDEAGPRRHNLSLVADEDKPPIKPDGFSLLNEPQLTRTTEAAVANARALGVLLEELQNQGALSEEAVARVRSAAVPHRITAEEGREFCRTFRLDDWDI